MDSLGARRALQGQAPRPALTGRPGRPGGSRSRGEFPSPNRHPNRLTAQEIRPLDGRLDALIMRRSPRDSTSLFEHTGLWPAPDSNPPPRTPSRTTRAATLAQDATTLPSVTTHSTAGHLPSSPTATLHRTSPILTQRHLLISSTEFSCYSYFLTFPPSYSSSASCSEDSKYTLMGVFAVL